PWKRSNRSSASAASPRASNMRPSLVAAGELRGSSSSALRNDLSSPAATSLSAGESTMPSRNWSICGGRIAPMNSATTLPSRNALTAGMLAIWKLIARLGLRSVSTLASSISPARFATAASSAGPSTRQGPHHSAQKSTTTGTSRERSTTLASKSASVTSNATYSRLAGAGSRQPSAAGRQNGGHGGDAARKAPDRLAGAGGPQLRPHGRLHHRAQRGGSDGDRPRSALGHLGGVGRARARGD